MNPRLASELAHLPDYLGSHILLTVGALLIGVAISLPLAIAVLRQPRLSAPVLGVASVIQTIPGLALLALMVPLLGRIGVVPALSALVLYSVLPVLRNTVTGVGEVDPNVVEAARGIGMTDRQILLRVQLPLASPTIVAGIRTASMWTVGMATLSTPVGATSLGNYIFSGLQTQNEVAVLVGCGAAAALAIGLDSLIRLGEVAAERQRPGLGALALALLLLLLAGAAAPHLASLLRGRGGDAIVVGAKTFSEQYILAHVIADRLRDAGIEVQSRDSLGSSVIFDALTVGEVDVYVDYSGTIWANHMKRSDTLSSEEVLEKMGPWLRERHGVALLGPLGFENAYALAMRREHAEAMGIERISDLAALAPSLKIGGDYEFFARPEWVSVRDRYGLAFAEQRSFDATLMYSAVANGHVDVISAFSTDGRIAAFDLVVLDDTLQALPPYDAVILLSRKAQQSGDLVRALTPLIGSIDDATMRSANKAVDMDGIAIERAAALLNRSAFSKE